jgi:hypothetical protein
MGAGTPSRKRDWIVAIAVAAGLGLLVFALFRAPPAPPAAAPAGARLAVGLGGSADVLLSQEAALHDPTPLFLPTQYNSTPDAPRRAPGVAFRNYPPELTFATDVLKIDGALPAPVPAPARPADALVENPPTNPLLGIGRTDRPVPVLAPRGAFVEIVAAGTGARVFSRALAQLPPVESGSRRLIPPPGDVTWQPLEFMVKVDPIGLEGPLVLTTRSGVESVDAYFEGYLAQILRVGRLLNPGFYRISVGP